MEKILSIIIPVYKVEDYIDKCLKSFVNQMQERVEILLIDDGSPDDCGKICDFYALKYHFIKSYHKENGGLSDARNYGLNLAKGEFIWFVDSDDYIESDCLSFLIECLLKKNADVSIIQSKIVEKDLIFDEKKYTIPVGIYSSHEYMEQLRKHPESVIFCAQYQICKRQFLINNKLLFYKGILHEDELWTPTVLIEARKIYYTGMNIYYHVMRDGSIMNSNNQEKSGLSDITVTKELFKVFENSGRKDLVYMRDHAVNTFLQAIWKIPDFLESDSKNRFLPIRNAYYRKTIIKGLLYCFSPWVYLKIHDYLKK